MAEREKFAHLLRRAGFGPTAQEVDAAEKTGYANAVEALLAQGWPGSVLGGGAPGGGVLGGGVLGGGALGGGAPGGLAGQPDPGATATPMPALGPDPYAALGRDATREQRQAAAKARSEQVRQATTWWLRRMVAAKHQFAEKLIFFWHGHWATSVQKVNSAQLMLRQQETFRAHGRGDFAVLVKAMLRDPALIIWLDGQRNTRKAPNENLARELMELFTVGIGGGYTEADVKAGARALTGWTVEKTTGLVRFEPTRFDDGAKTILGRSARFDANSLADLLVAQPASASFLASRLWFRYAQGAPAPDTALRRMVSAYGPERDITAMTRAMFTDPAFEATRGNLVKQPIEWVVGAARQLEIAPEAVNAAVGNALTALDQVPFRPPSVGGWPSGAAWLTTFALQTKLRLAQSLAAKTAAAVIDRLAAAPEAGRPDALARLLVVDAWGEATRAVLASTKDPRRLVTVGLASPEYSVF